MNLEINEEEQILLLGILEHTLDKMDMQEVMEYGSDITNIISKLNITETKE